MITGPNNYDLCNYSLSSTSASFDAETGDFEFLSNDYSTFGSQKVTFEITVSSGSTPQYVQFDLNLVDPCSIASLHINPRIINIAIVYGIQAHSSPATYTLDKQSYVKLSLESIDCPITLDIVNRDGGSLDSLVFGFD